MKVLVLNGSPAGKNSITLQTVHFISKFYEHTEFNILHVGQQIRKFEKDFAPAAEALLEADLILFCYPVYTFLVPAQLHRFIELIREHGIDLAGKYATQLTTSKHFYDMTAHRFIEENCDDLGMKYIRGLSADMEDLLTKKGQKDALDFFRYVCWNMKHGFCKPKSGQPENSRTGNAKIAIVADLPETDEGFRLRRLIDQFVSKNDASCDIVNIAEFPFKGGCLGCFHCAADGTCVYKDGFDTFLRDRIQGADAIVYAYSIRDHSMGSRFKMFDDRQFCNGHRTVTMGKPVGYLVNGPLSKEENLRTLMEARAQVGGNFLAGIACNEKDPDEQIARLAATMTFALTTGYNPPKNFYGVGGLKIFRDLIYQMQGLMREDHRFYKAHGFYDFPQKRKGMVAGMYLVGFMMTNEKLKKKMGGKMTEGMMMPYQNLLNRVDRARKRKEQPDETV